MQGNAGRMGNTGRMGGRAGWGQDERGRGRGSQLDYVKLGYGARALYASSCLKVFLKIDYRDRSCMMSLNASLIERLEAVAEPVVSGAGCELVDLRCLVENGRNILRLYADKSGGLTIDDCVAISRELGAVLDVEDIMPGRYSLEVSSPGLERPLKKEKDFLRFIGKTVKLKTSLPMEGRSNFKGRLESVHDGVIEILDDTEKVWSLKINDIKRANLVAEF